jgi:hypothetical protein
MTYDRYKSTIYIDGFGTKHYRVGNSYHRKDGPAVEGIDGRGVYYLNGKWIKPEEAIHDPVFKEKYPQLIESMLVYLVHNS